MRKGVMLAKKVNPLYLKRLGNRCAVQPKLNGQRCRAVCKHGHIKLYSSQGNEIISVPHINKQLADLTRNIDIHLDGELFNKEMLVQEISGICRRQYIKESHKQIQYHIFDIIDKRKPYQQRLMELGKLRIEEQESLFRTETFIRDTEEWDHYLNHFTSLGYEGIILRDLHAPYKEGKTDVLLKYKPVYVKSYKVTGAYEAMDKYGLPKDTLGGLHLLNEKNQKFSCGCGNLDHGTREFYWNQYLHDRENFPKKAIIAFPEYTKRGVPHQPILKSLKGGEHNEGAHQ